MQLICGGTANQSLPRFKFSKTFSLSVNPKHFSNTFESTKIIDEVIIPYYRFLYVGNWELVKSIVETKFRGSYVCLHSQAGNRIYQLVVQFNTLLKLQWMEMKNYKWLCSSLLCYNNFCTKTKTGDKIKYFRLLNNTETQQ